ncbi:MAG: hypothetical protein ACREIS_06465, partial [Nitrospiraceae bacterium]
IQPVAQANRQRVTVDVLNHGAGRRLGKSCILTTQVLGQSRVIGDGIRFLHSGWRSFYERGLRLELLFHKRLTSTSKTLRDRSR